MISQIGIDFSLTSPAMTIIDDEIRFFSFTRGYKEKSKTFNVHTNLKNTNTCEIINFDTFEPNGDYSKLELSKSKHANYLADLIIKTLLENVKTDFYKIGIEGFSYNSKGQSFIDLILYNSVLRNKILQLDCDFHIIAPTFIKKNATSKGNANKEKMLESFIKDENNKLTDFIISNSINTLEKVVKPIDDVIDSFYISKFLTLF